MQSILFSHSSIKLEIYNREIQVIPNYLEANNIFKNNRWVKEEIKRETESI